MNQYVKIRNIKSTVVRKQLETKDCVPSVIVSFIGKVLLTTNTKQSLGVEMYLTPATLYALRLSLQQGTVSSVFRRNMVERNMTKSAYILATVGLSMSIFSVRKMLTSKHGRHL